MGRHEQAKQARSRVDGAMEAASDEKCRVIKEALLAASYPESDQIDTGDDKLNKDMSVLREYWQDCKVLGT